jgi:probable biosynthetic protein (TIGR04098 family)
MRPRHVVATWEGAARPAPTCSAVLTDCVSSQNAESDMSKFWSFLSRQSPAAPAEPSATVQGEAQARAAQTPEERVIAIIRRECPAFSAADMQTPFDRLGIDSVGMLMIHTSVEEATKDAFDSRQWDQIVTPADLVKALRAAGPDRSPLPSETAAERRTCVLNMPQMALGGLSEHWLFKELGDLHWSSLTNAFARPSHMLKDEQGERIYATFTRIRIEATCPLVDFEENERIDLTLAMSRHGAGMFFGEAAVEGRGRSISATLMSTFSKFGQNASNMSLLKGLPEISPNFAIPVRAEFPAFGQDYRTRRSQALPEAIFECEYEIIPAYDINGVGLLYFAAYPIINDICAARHRGRSLMLEYSTLRRDVFYFGNSNPDEVLLYRLHEWRADDRAIDMTASLSRKSDGNVIAQIVTRKVRPERRSG